MRAAVLAVAVALSLGSSTPYQPMGFTGGYQETALGRTRYVVRASVNGWTDWDAAIVYAHRRALELCEAQGFRAYTVEDTWKSNGIWKAQIALVIRCGFTFGQRPVEVRVEQRPPSEPAEDDAEEH